MTEALKLEPFSEEDEGWNNIADEVWREYIFPGGEVYRIEAPIKLIVKRKPEGDSHRLIDQEGLRHYVRAGWLAIRFKGTWSIGK